MQNEENASVPEPAVRNPTPRFSIWTLAQRRTLLCLSALLLVILMIFTWRQSGSLADPPPRSLLRSQEIADRIDPNTADAAALSAISNLGEKHAAEIVEYREEFLRQHPDQRPFNTADDLLRLKGFGIATVTNLGLFLYFPSDSPAASKPYFQAKNN